MLKSSDLAWITVSDLKKAKKFFTETLGLKEQSHDDHYGWLELSCAEGGSMIGVCQANDEMRAGVNAVITLTVDHLEQTVVEFKKKGVNLIGEIVEVPGHVKMQTFTDTDGNTFQLVEMLNEG